MWHLWDENDATKSKKKKKDDSAFEMRAEKSFCQV